MRRRVYISPILDFNNLGDAFNQAPKLPFNIIFCDSTFAVQNGIKLHLRCKVAVFEDLGFFLELAERVNTAFFKTELTSTDQAPRTVPIMHQCGLNRRVYTIPVITIVTAFADEY